MQTDRNNISPRVGFAYRLDSNNKTVLRGGFGIFHPTGAAQGARDIMSRNPFRYTITNRRPTLQHGFTTGTVSQSLGFGNQGLALDLESPDIYQYNLTLERELPGNLGLRVSYLGSTMRKLLVHRDYNSVQASDVPLGDVDEDPEARRGCRSRSTARSWTSPRTPARASSTRCSSSCSGDSRAGLRIQRRLHAGRVRQQRARQRQQHDRRRAVRPVRHREGPRARSRTSSSTAS